MPEEISELEEQAGEIHNSLQTFIDSYCDDMKAGPDRPRGVDLAEIAASIFTDLTNRGEESMVHWSWMMAAALQRLGDTQLGQEKAGA